MTHRVTLIPGDGIGPELAEATTRVLDATGIGFEWESVDGRRGRRSNSTGRRSRRTSSTRCRRNHVALKGPITTPVGGGFRSVNVALRQALGLYANVRPARSMRGLDFRYENVDLIIVRENTEDLYAGHRAHGRPRRRREHQDHHPGGVRADRPLRLRVRGRERPAQGHRRPQGQHHEAVRRPVPRELPRRSPAEYEGRVEFEDRIVDNMCMQLVQKPELYDVLVLPNLYGDIVSDLCAGLVGGLGVAPGANIGTEARRLRAGPRVGAEVRRASTVPTRPR